ncbi:MAG: bifunctional phosphoribosyl-AMP cyclohydrolase/phosphoribosyl-ATP diphosphatase HisIE [Gemmatimonadaceae bacterium]
MKSLDIDRLDFSKSSGLVTVVVQDSATGSVLMVAHADREAMEKTLETGEMHFHSRARGLWHKGATSGNVQKVVSLSADCDNDAVLARVRPAGPACHTNSQSCFGEPAVAADSLAQLDQTILARQQALGQLPDALPDSYTQRLLTDRNLRLKKIGEEGAELIASIADNDTTRIADEAADLLYHVLVAARSTGIGLDDIRAVIAKRAKEE